MENLNFGNCFVFFIVQYKKMLMLRSDMKILIKKAIKKLLKVT